MSAKQKNYMNYQKLRLIQKMENLKKIHKRHMSLIEVLISFSLVVLCIFPLLFPHVFILKEYRTFIDKIELDHEVNLLYGKVLERLYKNEIPWNTIMNQQEIPINETEFSEKIPFNGSYRFTIDKIKSSEDKSNSAVLASLIFTFIHNNEVAIDKKSKTLDYKFSVFLLQKLNASVQIPESEDEEE